MNNKQRSPNWFYNDKLNHYYCYNRFPESKNICLMLDLGMVRSPKIGFIAKEKTNEIGAKDYYSGRKFKLVKIQKQQFEDQDLMKYKKDSFYVRCYCNNNKIIRRELWVLTNENN